MLRHAAPLLSFLLIAPALAETPAERASRQLEESQRRDRAAEALREPAPVPVPPPQMQPLEADRRSLQPDVGRPEQRGTTATGGDRPPSGSQNPQR